MQIGSRVVPLDDMMTQILLLTFIAKQSWESGIRSYIPLVYIDTVVDGGMREQHGKDIKMPREDCPSGALLWCVICRSMEGKRRMSRQVQQSLPEGSSNNTNKNIEY